MDHQQTLKGLYERLKEAQSVLLISRPRQPESESKGLQKKAQSPREPSQSDVVTGREEVAAAGLEFY